MANEYQEGLASGAVETWTMSHGSSQSELISKIYPGCVWYGRNRARVEDNAPRGSGGVGFLVVEEGTKHTKITVESPTYGDSERFARPSYLEGGEVLVVINAYRELKRKNFKIDDRAFLREMFREFKKAPTARVPSGVQKYTYMCTDSNIRVGRMQEVAADERDGEPENSGSPANSFI